MFKLRLVPVKTAIPFMAARKIAFGASSVLAVLSIVVLAILGLNAGIDFRGGILIEVKTPAAAAMTAMLPMASLRLHSQTERILASPSRKPISISAQTTLATSAANPTEPMISAPGRVPLAA